MPRGIPCSDTGIRQGIGAYAASAVRQQPAEQAEEFPAQPF